MNLNSKNRGDPLKFDHQQEIKSGRCRNQKLDSTYGRSGADGFRATELADVLERREV